MAKRKGRCTKVVHHAGKKPIKCGNPLDAQGKCPDHGDGTK